MLWGHENIKGLKDITIKDYWQWTYSDLIISENRSSFGLFLIAQALELTKIPRINWGEVDLRYKRKKVSVKINSRIQGWKQSKSKRIVFEIPKKKGWHAKKPDSLTFRNREADLFIFGLHTEKQVKKANLLDLSQWEFYVVSTTVLDLNYPSKNKIGIRQLKSISNPIMHNQIKEAVDAIVNEI